MAATGQAETFAMRFADNLRAGIEQARYDSRIKIGHKPFKRRGAVHHRHAGHHDVVLDGDALAAELSAGCAFD